MNNTFALTKPALFLAPMEGMTDWPMRQLLTRGPGFTHCVSEFFRISQNVPPPEVFTRSHREILTGGRTNSGVPVFFQLLGGDPEKLAQAALQAAKIGALGIDLNFGCPARTVNSNDGGATLLKYPQRIFDIVRAVRQSVPAAVSVSAKLRLGWENPEDIFVNAEMAEKAGANWITIHARTKAQGYKPPADWEMLGRVKKNMSIPLVANGEIWTLDDFKKCRDVTGCEHYMLGRGAFANPNLAHQVAFEMGLTTVPAQSVLDKTQWKLIIEDFIRMNLEFVPTPAYALSQLKQWLKLVYQQNGLTLFESIKTLTNLSDVPAVLAAWTETESSI